MIPGVGSLQGGTIFRPNLLIPQRYIISTAISLATGSCLISGFEILYGFITIFALTVLSSTPEMWPPIMDDPWKPDSLHTFWAKRWHQVLRETFFVYGGFLGKWLGGNMGMLFGTFIGSGLYHELSAYTLGKGFDWDVMLFFVVQAPLLLLEKLWQRVTGQRVGGIYGTLWVYFCVLVTVQSLGMYDIHEPSKFYSDRPLFQQQTRGIAAASVERSLSHLQSVLPDGSSSHYFDVPSRYSALDRCQFYRRPLAAGCR
jgi:hypothetical protein